MIMAFDVSTAPVILMGQGVGSRAEPLSPQPQRSAQPQHLVSMVTAAPMEGPPVLESGTNRVQWQGLSQS